MSNSATTAPTRPRPNVCLARTAVRVRRMGHARLSARGAPAADHRQHDGVPDRLLFHRLRDRLRLLRRAPISAPDRRQSAAGGGRSRRAARSPHQRHRRGDPARRRRVHRLVLFRPRLRSRVRHSDQLHHRRGGRLRHLRHAPLPPRRRGDLDRPCLAPRHLVPLPAGARAVHRRAEPAGQSLYILRRHHLLHHRADRGLRLHRGRSGAGRGRRAARQHFAGRHRRAAEGTAGRAGRRQRRRGLRPVQRSCRLHRALAASSARRAPSPCSIRSSPSSIAWPRATAWRRSRPSATATWR